MPRELLEKQQCFLANARKEAEKTISLFEKEMKRFKKGENFESAKSAHARVKQRIKDIDGMISRVKLEIADLPPETKAPKPKKRKKPKAKKQKKRKKK